jgi:hypothetical protein
VVPVDPAARGRRLARENQVADTEGAVAFIGERAGSIAIPEGVELLDVLDLESRLLVEDPSHGEVEAGISFRVQRARGEHRPSK